MTLEERQKAISEAFYHIAIYAMVTHTHSRDGLHRLEYMMKIIDEIPHEARLERYGMDFGYSVDPTAIIAIYKYNDGFILDEITYQKGLSNKTIADILLNKPQALVVADSAEPKSIDEIREYGVNIIGALKGQGSVNKGIQYVQDQKISLTKRSVNTLKAYRNYLFKVDKDGKVTNDPDDTIHEWSNSMDAVRYGLESFKPSGETNFDFIQQTDW
jgi:phage terminase large subunit